MGYNQQDLANVIGLKSRASEIQKRKLKLEMIRLIHENLKIPTEVLIQAYNLKHFSGNGSPQHDGLTN